MTKLALLFAIAASSIARGSTPPAIDTQPEHSKTPNPSEAVCRYVADAWNVKRGASITVQEGHVTVDGVRHAFSQSSGNCEAALNVDPPFKGDNDLPGVPVSDPSSIDIVPFGGADYVVFNDSVGPYRVYDPVKGPVCDFDRQFTPILAENHAAICPVFLRRRDKSNIGFSPTREHIPIANKALGVSPSGGVNFFVDGVADVRLSSRGPKVGLAHFVSQGFDSCDGEWKSGITIFKAGKPETNAAAKSLNNLNWSFRGIGVGDGSLIRYNGRTYIELTGGFYEQGGHLDRTLVQLDQNSSNAICRVEQKVTYVPIKSRPE